MTNDKAIQLFAKLDEQEKIEVLKKLIYSKIENSECWAQCDTRVLIRIFKLLTKHK